jgi:16S rRNA processing protein RimM
MAENPYVLIGHTRKAHGITGELKLHIEERYLEDFLKNERVFLDIKGTKIPYFVANVRGKGEMILQLEDVSDRDAAAMLQGREVFLREKDLLLEEERELEYEEDVLEYAHVTGFLLVDKTLGEIGLIDEVLEMPQQEMAFLKYHKREVLVPLNEHLIVEIDLKNKKVMMDLPEGLLE